MKLPPAGPRLIAFLLDYLVISAYIILLTLLTQGVMLAGAGPSITRFLSNPIRADLFAFLILVLPVILYFSLMESSPKQATWGKRRMHLCVTDEQGGRLSRSRAILRSVVKFLPWQITHTSLFQIPGWPLNVVDVPTVSVIGFALVWVLIFVWMGFMLFHPARRTPYDLAAASRVVVSTARPS